ncbi:Ribonuclease II [Forsythia ovata]|uniref:Ribonuclease II n=1 Tax=Forsythia ovata TaxID=205694 RepID=A0ABD1T2Z5_9LAMI
MVIRLELKSSEELLENKSGKRMLQKGLLLEFKKDPKRVLLAVAQKSDGKKNWMDPILLEFAWIELLEKNKSVRVKELAEVDELLRRKHAKEAAENELKEFVKLLKYAREMPSYSKPAKSSWRTEEKIRHRIEIPKNWNIAVFAVFIVNIFLKKLQSSPSSLQSSAACSFHHQLLIQFAFSFD